MRCAACSGASQTMVMREVSGRSDSPTVRETMLRLRRRKRDATRVRTPGLSWTRATKVWSMGDASLRDAVVGCDAIGGRLLPVDVLREPACI